MKDTPLEVRERYREMLMQRSPEERFMMGIDMLRMATALMLAGLEADGSKGLRERVFVRMYGGDFPAEEQARIVDALRRFETSRSTPDSASRPSS